MGEHISPPTHGDQPSTELSQSGFARSKLQAPETFAREVSEAVVSKLTTEDDRYELDVVATIVWGSPLTDSSHSGDR